MHKTITLISETARATQEIGERLGACLRPGDVVALRGELGAGKTTLAQAIGRRLGVKRRLRSPTFVVASRYPLQKQKIRSLNHLDLYRLHRPQVSDDGLIQELMNDTAGITIIEWADRLPRLPRGCLNVDIKISAGGRRMIRLSNLPRRGWKWPEQSVSAGATGGRNSRAHAESRPRRPFARR